MFQLQYAELKRKVFNRVLKTDKVGAFLRLSGRLFQTIAEQYLNEALPLLDPTEGFSRRQRPELLKVRHGS